METVFSDPTGAKEAFLEEARKRGYRIARRTPSAPAGGLSPDSEGKPSARRRGGSGGSGVHSLAMTHEELLQRISIDPAICGGKPCIRGHRIWVSLIVDFLAAGMTVEEILAEYPQLTVEDIRACLAYASEMTRERTVQVG